ncbi:MAG: DoxX family protein [Marinifilaceae bacterium]|jgi:uncharacterized membrane protein YphA (DoxX/SURF4 family)|nr:DoxX family protein [Marinifilaceae bacterium]
MKKIINLLAFLLGAVFIYSGFTKGIDPLGTTYKLTDYFNAFHLSALSPLSLPLSFALSWIESIVGIFLIFNYKPKLSGKIALIFMCIFTPITLYLAIANPVHDCGCFGDAFKISNWDTFFKNLVLISMAFVVLKFNKHLQLTANKKFTSSFVAIAVCFTVGLSFYSYRHLPIVDFRPYKIGVNLREATSVPPNAQPDVYKSIFRYKNLKSKEIKTFNEDNYPWQDSLNWEYVDMSQELIKEGYRPPIQNFIVMHPENGEITDEIINNPDFTFLLIAYNLKDTDTKYQNKINELYNYAISKGQSFYCITAALNNDIENFKEKYKAEYPFCTMDEVELKTVVRSNPGLVLINNGTIINKWHINDIPSVEDFNNKDLLAYSLSEARNSNANLIYIIVIAFFFVLFGIHNTFMKNE